MILLVASGLMIRTVQAMRQVAPGFVRPEEVLTLRVSIPETLIPDDERALRTHEQIVRKLEQIPGVKSVGVSNSITMDGFDSNDPIFVEDFPPAGDKLACARLALAIKSGNTTKFLGELGFELINKDPGPFDLAPTVVVPANFLSELANTLMDPAFLLQALPPVLRDIAAQLRDLAESGIPDAVGDPLKSAAEGLEGIALLFAGGDQGGSNGLGLTYGNPLNTVLKKLRVTLI